MAGSFADFASALTFTQMSSGIIPLALPGLSHFRFSRLQANTPCPSLPCQANRGIGITSLRFLMGFCGRKADVAEELFKNHPRYGRQIPDTRHERKTPGIPQAVPKKHKAAPRETGYGLNHADPEDLQRPRQEFAGFISLSFCCFVLFSLFLVVPSDPRHRPDLIFRGPAPHIASGL
jgi:hypothetical protein